MSSAHLHVAVRRSDGFPDGYAGLGSNSDEALADALDYFWQAVQERGATETEEFVWSDSPDR